MSDLVIVESPAKAKTIQKYLGQGYEVIASMGHIRDLPKSKMGVDKENDFKPQYTDMKGKEDVIKELKKQWMNENKPHGFDVQEYRMGGVICRMLGVKDRIEAYLRGEAADIAEHDETLLHDVWQGRNAVTGRMAYNSYELISSVNRF